MKLKIAKTRFSLLGDRAFPLILIDDQVDLFSAPYLLRCLNQGLAINTIEIRAKGILALYRFCLHQNIDLVKRMERLEILQMGEIEALSDWLSTSLETQELVADGTHTLRLRAAKSFVLFWWDTYQSRASNNPERLNHARNKREVMLQAFKIASDAPFTRQGQTPQGLPPELRAKFFEIINPLPENELNPFRSVHVRWRNYVICLTLILAGNRRSETVLLQLHDLNIHGRDKYLEIVQYTHFLPPKSPHLNAASLKTKGRKIGLSDEIALIFEYYIKHMRKKFKGYLKNNDLFLSTKGGKPLSVDGVYGIIETIVKAHPQFKGHLAPHTLRNTFHDLLSDALDSLLDSELGASSPMIKQAHKKTLQEQAGGWSRGSQMTDRYPAGAIERRVMKLTQALQTQALDAGSTPPEQ